MGNTGLCSEFLNYFVTDLAGGEGWMAHHVFSQSTCLSADVTAAYDPTYASAFEAGNSCYLNRGVGVAKYTGSRGKSGSNDANAEFVAQVRKIFDDNGVIWQIGELGKVDQGGGGTVALDISRLNADVIDVGVPVLSMHSPSRWSPSWTCTWPTRPSRLISWRNKLILGEWEAVAASHFLLF